MPLNALKKFNMKDILVIDNYDSFTYNLVHYLEDLECSVTVKRKDTDIDIFLNPYIPSCTYG